MKRFVEGEDRGQGTLFPERLDDWICEDNPMRVTDDFVDEIDLVGLGCGRVKPRATGMIYEDYGEKKLNDPDIMGPPMVWLASAQSDGFNGERFIAQDWDTSLPPTEAARGAIGQIALSAPPGSQRVTQR